MEYENKSNLIDFNVNYQGIKKYIKNFFFVKINSHVYLIKKTY